ncbi:MAG: hypothetical protein N4A49_15960, partial [Marinifilaceae bacterium]|nr:hypothetical protein [Marinifilaceae bacterium]
TGKYRYKWYENGELIRDENSNKISNLAAGDYSLEVWDSNNCPFGNTSFGKNNGLIRKTSVKGPNSELEIQIEYILKPSYPGKADASIRFFAKGGWKPYLYSINGTNWQISDQFKNLKAGDYTVQIKDSKAVSRNLNFTIPKAEPIRINTETKDLLCYNDNSGEITIRNITGGVSPYLISIDNGKTFVNTSKFSKLSAGNYKIKIQDANKNTETFNCSISQPNKLEFEIIDIKNSHCFKENGSVKLKIKAGTAPYNIYWNNPEFGESLNLKNLKSGSYTVNCKDDNNCLANKNINITDADGPEIMITKQKDCSCSYSKDGEIEVQIKSSTPTYQVEWSNDYDNKNLKATKLAVGDYSLKITDQNNCIGNLNFKIDGPPVLKLITQELKNPTCKGAKNGLVKLKAIGGNDKYKYIYKNKEFSSLNFNTLTEGKHSFGLLDAKNCKANLDLELKAPNKRKIEIPKTFNICANQNQEINASEFGERFEWFLFDEKISESKTIDINTEGDYKLICFDKNNCASEKSFQVFKYDYTTSADFVTPDKSMPGDTLIAVDISWEHPDNLEWTIPENFELIRKDGSELWLKVIKPGICKIGLNIINKNCTDYIEKEISIENNLNRKAKRVEIEGTFITKLSLFPNPNDGEFRTRICLNKIDDIQIEIIDLQMGIKVFSEKHRGLAAYNLNFTNKKIFKKNRMYSLIVKTKNESKNTKFIVY